MSTDNSDRVSRRDFLQTLGMAGIVGTSGLLLSACGGGSSDSSSGGDGKSSSVMSGDKVTLRPKGNQMKFKQTEFTVPPGKEIELVFENTASSPSMQHNVVLLNEAPSDKVFKAVGEDGMSAGAEKEYVPDHDAILAHTPIAKPGETVSVTFTTPEETGDYGYLCTYPGHWAQMQGTMHVK